MVIKNVICVLQNNFTANKMVTIQHIVDLYSEEYVLNQFI